MVSYQDHIYDDKKGKAVVDIVLTAKKGGADFFTRGYPSLEPEIYENRGGLIVGMFRLVRALQALGTVPAIDWDDWFSTYTKHI